MRASGSLMNSPNEPHRLCGAKAPLAATQGTKGAGGDARGAAPCQGTQKIHLEAPSIRTPSPSPNHLHQNAKYPFLFRFKYHYLAGLFQRKALFQLIGKRWRKNRFSIQFSSYPISCNTITANTSILGPSSSWKEPLLKADLLMELYIQD